VEGYDAAVSRANAYLNAGADGVFPEALESRDEFARFAKDVDTVLLANMTEFGKTPYLTADEFAEMGYDLVIYPVTLQRCAMKATQEALRTLKTERSQRSSVGRMQTRAELYELLGYEASLPARPPVS
jgi:methylisocitrate lyase